MGEPSESTWLSSKELLTISGISRATLNNYIKWGIVPRPRVQKPRHPTPSVKQIGYFPPDVLKVIEEVKRRKREGVSMADIILSMAGTSAAPEANQSPSGPDQRSVPPPPELSARSIPVKDEGLQLSMDKLQIPAYLVNYQFEIEWINEHAEREIFNKKISAIKTSDMRNIFRLFLSWEFNSYVKDTDSIIDFHMRQLRARQPKTYLTTLYAGISEREAGYLSESYDRVTPAPTDFISEANFELERKDGAAGGSYRVYSTLFREGILFIFEPHDRFLKGLEELLSEREQVIRDLLKQRLPTLVPFCVLVGDLQDSVRICAELPPEEYFELINSMWKAMEETFRKYYGIYGKHAGDGFVYYFLRERNSSYIMNSISCAMELKLKMERLSSEWKSRKKWYNELYLNIGLNEGEEYFSAVHASTNIEFTALGDTINYAARLSDLARTGAIYATKNLINKLTDEEKKAFRFGVRRRAQDGETFVENSYSRVMDLVPHDSPKSGKFMDIAALPVTEIIP
jgi:adenylate cyclase